MDTIGPKGPKAFPDNPCLHPVVAEEAAIIDALNLLLSPADRRRWWEHQYANGEGIGPGKTRLSDEEIESKAKARLKKAVVDNPALAEKYLPTLWGVGDEWAKHLLAHGAERINVAGKGVQTLFPGQDTLPCRGSGEQVQIRRWSEIRVIKGGARKGEKYAHDFRQATCPACGIVRDVAKKEATGATWIFPVHQDRRVIPSAYVDHGCIVARPPGVKDRGKGVTAGMAVMATVMTSDSFEERPDQPSWEPTRDVGASLPTVAAAQATRFVRAEGGEVSLVRGLRMAVRLYRAWEIKGTVCKVPSAEVEANKAKARAEKAQATAHKKAAAKGEEYSPGRKVPLTEQTAAEIQASRIKREAAQAHPVMCDATKAPIRAIRLF